MSKYILATLFVLSVVIPLETQAKNYPGLSGYTYDDPFFTLVSSSQNDQGFRTNVIPRWTSDSGNKLTSDSSNFYTSTIFLPIYSMPAKNPSGESQMLPATGDYLCKFVLDGNTNSPAATTYCSYQSYGGGYGSLCVGDLSYLSGIPGNTGGGATCGSTYWPPRAVISIYEAAPTPVSLNSLIDTLSTYTSGYVGWLNRNQTGYKPSDPGYSDVCFENHSSANITRDLTQDSIVSQRMTANGYTGTGASAASSPRGNCEVYKYEPATAPTATLTANPTTVTAGNASALTYSCSGNATSASISGVGSVSPAAPGTVSVTPSANTTYTLTCTNATGSGTANATVAVSAAPVLTASCSVSPASITAGGSATWSATASGGSGSYSYSWSGSDSLSGSGASVSKTYASAGTKAGSVTVTSGSRSVTQACSNSLAVAEAPVATSPNLTASIGPAVTVPVGQANSYTGSVSNTGTANVASSDDLFLFYKSDQVTYEGYVYAFPKTTNAGATVSHSVSFTFPNSGTYYYRLCADWQGNVAESNEGDNCSAFQTVTVSPVVAAADLTAGSVSPGSATVGTPVTFSAVASNIASGASGSFPLLFQLQTLSVADSGERAHLFARYLGMAVAHAARFDDSDGGGGGGGGGGGSQPSTPSSDILFNSGYIGGLAQGASGTGSAAYTFSKAGTYQIRACANYNTAWTAITTESNYGNNCGPWTTVTVSPAYVAPPTCSLSASSSFVPATLTWSSSNATFCTGGGFSTGAATGGSAAVSTAGNYTLSCSGAGGACSASASLTNGTCPGPASVSITAAPNRVRAGQTSTITWSASNVPGESPSCTVSGPGLSQTIPASAAPSCVIPNGSAAPVINTQSTYTITCGGTSKSVTVNVIPQFQEF